MSLKFKLIKMIQSRKLVSKTSLQLLFSSQRRCFCEKIKPRDMIGSADPISNLRHIKYAAKENENPLEQELRQRREELQQWNEVFWTKHNLNFIKKKHEFEEKELAKKGPDDQALSADEISVFYKNFLDENWKTHMKYLFKWYRKNVYVTFLHFRIKIQEILTKS